MFKGTLLTTKADPEEINRALLDLLKKINEQAETLTGINSRLEILEKKLEAANN